MRHRRAAGVAAIAGVTVTVVLAAAILRGQPGATASDPAGGRYVFIDEARQSSFSVNLEKTSPDLRRFSFGVMGLGLFFGDRPASVEFKSDSSIIVRYEGSGVVDRSARLDFVFNLTLATGTADPAPIRLEAQVNPDRVTSSAQLWYAGVQYKLVDKQPASDPSGALRAILAALAAQDWPALYDLGYSGFRGAISRADFIDRMAAAWAGRGTVTATAVVAAPRLGNRRAGFDAAQATISFTLTRDGVATPDPGRTAGGQPAPRVTTVRPPDVRYRRAAGRCHRRGRGARGPRPWGVTLPPTPSSSTRTSSCGRITSSSACIARPEPGWRTRSPACRSLGSRGPRSWRSSAFPPTSGRSAVRSASGSPGMSFEAGWRGRTSGFRCRPSATRRSSVSS